MFTKVSFMTITWSFHICILTDNVSFEANSAPTTAQPCNIPLSLLDFV